MLGLTAKARLAELVTAVAGPRGRRVITPGTTSQPGSTRVAYLNAPRGGFMSRFTRALLVALAASCVMVLAAAPSATAGSGNQLGSTLGELWTTVLQTPVLDNPFSGCSTCVQLPDGQLAPFGPTGAGPCTAERGTKIFVAARSQECSTFAGDDCDGTAYSQLVANAQALDAKYTTH